MTKYPTRRKAVAHACREARLATGLTQRQFSDHLGERNNYAHLIEAGRQAIDGDKMMVWGEACATTASLMMLRAEQLLGAQPGVKKGVAAKPPSPAKRKYRTAKRQPR
jgi:transcriptional regulator with XRE-family HTH domain